MTPPRRFWFWKSNLEFTTQLPVEECQKRLTDMQADVWRISPMWSIFKDGDVGFLWYGKKDLISVLLQGPALLGSLTDTQHGTLIKADFRPFVSVTWICVIGIGTLFFFTLRQIILAQVSIQLLLLAILLWGVVVLVYWLMLCLLKPHWKNLVKQLQIALPPIVEG